MEKKMTLLSLLMISGLTVKADVDTSGVGVVLTTVPIAFVCIIVLLFASVRRFGLKNQKVNLTLNISAILLIACCLISIMAIGLTGIDPGFLGTCIGLIVISVLLMIFNTRGWNR
jgi:hypothetical protein